MSLIGSLRRQADLGVGSNLNYARTHAQICDADSPDFRVILRGDYDVKRRGQRAVASDKFGAVFVKRDFVRVGFDAARLVAGRPDFTCLFIA